MSKLTTVLQNQIDLAQPPNVPTNILKFWGYDCWDLSSTGSSEGPKTARRCVEMMNAPGRKLEGLPCVYSFHMAQPKNG